MQHTGLRLLTNVDSHLIDNYSMCMGDSHSPASRCTGHKHTSITLTSGWRLHHDCFLGGGRPMNSRASSICRERLPSSDLTENSSYTGAAAGASPCLAITKMSINAGLPCLGTTRTCLRIARPASIQNVGKSTECNNYSSEEGKVPSCGTSNTGQPRCVNTISDWTTAGAESS